eukprot:13447530-Alexandrium_andersonii.AAC.1
MRWAYASRETGGLEGEGARSAAREFFEALIYPVLHLDEPLSFQVEVVSPWVCAWPRPQPFMHPTFQATVTKEGLLDLRQLHDMAVGKAKRLVHAAWWRELRSRMQSRVPEDPALLQFFQKCGDSKVLQPLVAQVAWRISSVLETRFGGEATKRGKGSLAP